MKNSRFLLSALTVLSSSLFAPESFAQSPPPAAPTRTTTITPSKQPEKLYSFKFEGSNLDIVMETYCGWAGKQYIKPDSVNANITLKADNLTKQECMDVVEAVLAMNNIALVPYSDKFIKVLQANSADLLGQGLPLNYDSEATYTGSQKLVTQIIPLTHVEASEIQATIQQVMNTFGKIHVLTRSNSMMITDTETNILRIRELIDFIDQASARIEPRIYPIKWAKASDIAGKINEIVTAAQGDQKSKTPAVVGNPNARTPPGVVRAARNTPAAPAQATISSSESAESAAIIQGNVKVMSDERTNIIIIFSMEENFTFFEKIIEVLDVEVEPAISFEVVGLEYADATELAGTLNELVGAASKSKTTSASGTPQAGGPRNLFGANNTRDNAAANTGSESARVAPNEAPIASDSAVNNLNRLSEETKILADARSNSILLMGQKADIAALKNVIARLDVMLEQVMIEAAIFEVTLDDSLRHGIDWLYQSDDGERIGAWDGQSLAQTNNPLNLVASGALTYYQKLTGIDTRMAINLSATDGNIRLLNNPVIMTTDNTEASLKVGRQRPVVTSTDSYGNSSGTRRSSYEYKDIGIQLKVTPRINPQRVVVMEIVQNADQLGTDIEIDGNPVPTILNREFQAQVAVPDGSTIALGGLVNTTEKKSSTKIPILGDIPLIGSLLFSSANNESEQVELVVLLTPYVLTNHEELRRKTESLYDATDMNRNDWPNKGWSKSPLQNREKVEYIDFESQPKPTMEPEPAPEREQEAEPEKSPEEQPEPAVDNTEIQDLLKQLEQ